MKSITVSLNAIEKILMEIGKELSCPICLGVLEDAVSLPCTHCFCKAASKGPSRSSQREGTPCPHPANAHCARHTSANDLPHQQMPFVFLLMLIRWQ